MSLNGRWTTVGIIAAVATAGAATCTAFGGAAPVYGFALQTLDVQRQSATEAARAPIEAGVRHLVCREQMRDADVDPRTCNITVPLPQEWLR